MATQTTEQIEARVRDALESFGAEPEEITRDSTWAELDIDSLDLVELAQIMEDEYGVLIKEEDLKQIQTVGQAIDFVTERAGS